MPITVTGIVSSLRSAWADVNPLARGISFSTYEFLEDRVFELEQEIAGLRRELGEAQAALGQHSPEGQFDENQCACR
jgi:hypothetical protein